MREIVLDTETTGLDPNYGHRIVEVGCVELHNWIPTGREFHVYIDPKRSVPQPAFAVHGLSQEFLSQFKQFHEVAQSMIDFLADDPLVIHNANFDMKFLQYELEKAGFKTLDNPVVDTLAIARKKFPGAPASLDMLCKRFKVDASSREKHGALLDAQLLSEVYLELNGGRQQGLDLVSTAENAEVSIVSPSKGPAKVRETRPRRTFAVPQNEAVAHKTLLGDLGQSPWEIGSPKEPAEDKARKPA